MLHCSTILIYIESLKYQFPRPTRRGSQPLTSYHPSGHNRAFGLRSGCSNVCPSTSAENDAWQKHHPCCQTLVFYPKIEAHASELHYVHRTHLFWQSSKKCTGTRLSLLKIVAFDLTLPLLTKTCRHTHWPNQTKLLKPNSPMYTLVVNWSAETRSCGSHVTVHSNLPRYGQGSSNSGVNSGKVMARV